MGRSTGFVIAVLVALLAGCSSGAVEESGPGLELEDCLLRGFAGSSEVAADCGSVTVPENRSQQGGRTLEIKVALVRAISRTPDPVPILFLAGGPGQAATESYGAMRSAFRELNRTHDILLIDQRGTGGSGQLRCPQITPWWMSPGEDGGDVFREPSDEQLVEMIQSCRETLEADLTQYHTTSAVHDFDRVREAMGYQQLHLYGVSYGTRAAQVYLKEFPDRVKTVVLDGVVPQSLTLGETVARDAQRALDLIFERCRAEPSCAERFPELEKRFEEVIGRLRRSPAEVRMNHPRTGKPLRFHLNAEMAGTGIRFLSYAPEAVAMIPLLIDSAAQGRLAPMAAQFLIVSDQLNESIADAMGFSVICTEDFPLFDQARIEELNRESYLGTSQTERLRLVCENWPRGELEAGFHEPATQDVPVLLLSGEADPVTPPEYGDEVAKFLPDSLHIVAPGVGHNVIPRGCVSKIVTRFIESGSLADLETACVSQIEPSPFFMSPAGPTP